MVFIIVIVITILLFLVILGFLYVPRIYIGSPIQPITSGIKPVCLSEQVECLVDSDCAHCDDILDITCQNMGGKRYCLPAKPDKQCNEDLGGVWTWTGWASVDRKEWDCLCTYPEISGNRGCTKINPNVCAGGEYTYSAKIKNRGPLPSDCTCPSTSVKIVTENNIPMCIPLHPGICADDTVCKSFYT